MMSLKRKWSFIVEIHLSLLRPVRTVLYVPFSLCLVLVLLPFCRVLRHEKFTVALWDSVLWDRPPTTKEERDRMD